MNLWSEVVVGAQFTMDIAKCFNSSSKKRDVSDQSCNGEEPKKVREGSLNDSNVLLDDVFCWKFEVNWVFTYSCQLHEKYWGWNKGNLWQESGDSS